MLFNRYVRCNLFTSTFFQLITWIWMNWCFFVSKFYDVWDVMLIHATRDSCLTVVHFQWAITHRRLFCYSSKYATIWNLWDDICGLRLTVGEFYLDKLMSYSSLYATFILFLEVTPVMLCICQLRDHNGNWEAGKMEAKQVNELQHLGLGCFSVWHINRSSVGSGNFSLGGHYVKKNFLERGQGLQGYPQPPRQLGKNSVYFILLFFWPLAVLGCTKNMRSSHDSKMIFLCFLSPELRK